MAAACGRLCDRTWINSAIGQRFGCAKGPGTGQTNVVVVIVAGGRDDRDGFFDGPRAAPWTFSMNGIAELQTAVARTDGTRPLGTLYALERVTHMQRLLAAATNDTRQNGANAGQYASANRL